MSGEERREVIREAIHRTLCDERASHNASFGKCSPAADAVAMSLAESQPALDTCGVLARCGRPKDHSGPKSHHGGWRLVKP